MGAELEVDMDERHDFDVIVIGAGPGGLSAAAYLGMAGRRVLVVDARDQVGGHMSAFTHDGYEFDIGLHYTSESAVQEVLRPLGVRVAFRELDPSAMFGMIGPGQGPAEAFLVPRGIDAFRARLLETFPVEHHAVHAFLDTAQLLAAELEQVPEHPHLRDLPGLPWRLRGLLRYGTATAGGYLDSLHASPQLKSALLGWTSGSFAVAPSRTSLPVAAGTVVSYLDGLSYPQGGSRTVTEGLADAVRRQGGELLLGTEVSRILVDEDGVHGVRVRSASVDVAPEPGLDVLAGTVVSAVDVKQTYLQLLPPEVVPTRVLRRVRSYEPALPLAVVYLALDRDLAAEGYPNSVRRVADDDDLDAVYATLRAGELPERCAVSVWVASVADPGNPRLCPPGQTNLQLISPAPAHHRFWGVAPGSGPTRRYLARRRQVRDLLVRLAERAVPGLGESVVHEETATPVTDMRIMHTTEGTTYGPAFTPRQALSRLGPVGPVEGLFHGGASVRPSHGLVGTLQGGVAAASAVTTIPVSELQGGGLRAAEVGGR